jgi:hypothetical protein
MNNRERAMAILNYEDYDSLPIVHFGFWPETLEKWYKEGYVTKEEARGWYDGNEYDLSISKKLGFDFNWYSCFGGNTGLFPAFERKVIEEMPNGMRKVLNWEGVVVLEKDDAVSIPAEVDHILKDRESWEKHYLPKLQYTEERIDFEALKSFEKHEEREVPLGLHCGSLFGVIRDWLGLENVSYLYVDDPDLYDEIIDTVGNLSYRVTERVLRSGVKFDFGHFWEDLCFKNGPLVIPSVFKEKVGPHYNRITNLLKEYDINIVSLDSDGKIDSLLPIWLENGVNTMFPIEVGTWEANIKPWREEYGRELRGVGGMNKTVFAYDYDAVDKEVERMKPLVELGGYIPCIDHRIAPDAKWENVQYYCERMRKAFNYSV